LDITFERVAEFGHAAACSGETARSESTVAHPLCQAERENGDV